MTDTKKIQGKATDIVVVDELPYYVDAGVYHGVDWTAPDAYDEASALWCKWSNETLQQEPVSNLVCEMCGTAFDAQVDYYDHMYNGPCN